MACTQEPRVPTDEDIDDFLENAPSPDDVTPPAKLPKATDIASSVNLITVAHIDLHEDATDFIPDVFKSYTDAGGERLRLVFHRALIEFKTNIADHFETRGCIKFSMIISFLEMCSKFTPRLDEPTCTLVIQHVKFFSDSIQAVLTMPPINTVGQSIATYSTLSQEKQLEFAEKLFPSMCDGSVFETNHTPIKLALSGSCGRSPPMFRILYRYAEEDTAIKAYACRVLDKLAIAINNKNMYIAHIILKYFIYTVGVLHTLIIADWQAMLASVNNVEETAIEHMGYKISTVLCGFDYLCTHMLHKQYDFEKKIANEYLKLTHTPSANPTQEASGCELL